MKQKKFLIIGGGTRGLRFAKILEKDLSSHVVAIVDNYVEGNASIANFLKKNSIENVEIINELDAALEKYSSEKVDGVFLMTPEWTHLEIFKKLIAGDYNIFLEKPIATTSEDVYSIQKLAQNYDKLIHVGFVLRFSAFYKKIKEWVDNDRIGQIVTIQMNERLALLHGSAFKRNWHAKKMYTGGYLNEKCCHDLDLMCWLKEKQAKPLQVVSYGSMKFYLDSIGEKTCEDCKRDCPLRDDYKNANKYFNGKLYIGQYRTEK